MTNAFALPTWSRGAMMPGEHRDPGSVSGGHRKSGAVFSIADKDEGLQQIAVHR